MVVMILKHSHPNVTPSGSMTPQQREVAIKQGQKVDFEGLPQNYVEKPSLIKTLGKRAGALVVVTGVTLGLLHESDAPKPALKATITATGNETPSGLAHAIAGNGETRNIQDEIVNQARKDGKPGIQPGEQIHVTQQYAQQHEQQVTPKP